MIIGHLFLIIKGLFPYWNSRVVSATDVGEGRWDSWWSVRSAWIRQDVSTLKRKIQRSNVLLCGAKNVFLGCLSEAVCVVVPGPEPEDQPLLHLDQQHCLTPCREPLLHPSPHHAWPSRHQGLRLRFCQQSHLHPGEQRQRHHR